MAFKMTHQGFGADTGDPVPSTSPKEKPKTDTNKNTSTTTRMRVGSVHASGDTALSFKKDSPNYSKIPSNSKLTRREIYQKRRLKQRSDPNHRKI